MCRRAAGFSVNRRRGPDADRYAKLLIYLAVKGSLLGAYSQTVSGNGDDVQVEPQITSIYRRFGLNDRQIEILARATPKRD
jgi:hypothetical protein